MGEIRPFKITASDANFVDLRRRLKATRWLEAEVVDDWSQGIPLSYVQEIGAYWADDDDWRRAEVAFNRFDQFITEIDGVNIHFTHQRPPYADAFSVIMTHGWPGSIVEFHKVIEPLTNPATHGGWA